MVCAKLDVAEAKTESEILLAVIRIKPQATEILSFLRRKEEKQRRINNE
jgi:hypothetical protein